MPQKALRFGVHDGKDRRAATWKLWAEESGGKSDVYLACRSLGGALKISLHESGKWHYAYTKNMFENKVKEVIPGIEDRFIEKWERPPEFAPGCTMALRIVSPWSAPTNLKKGPRINRVFWIPNAPKGKATEINIIITKPTMPITDWPGKRSMGTSLIGSIPLESGETIWAIYWVIGMPNYASMGKVTGRPYKGVEKKNMPKDGLRLLIYKVEPDGSRTIHDCPLKIEPPKINC